MSNNKAFIAKIGHQDPKNEKIVYFKAIPSEKLVKDC